MSLNYDYTKVKDLKKIENEPGISQMIVFATMTVGISIITEENAEEFYNRIHLVELLHGAYLNSNGGKPRYITRDDINARITLVTNASNFSRAEFNKRQLKRYWSEK